MLGKQRDADALANVSSAYQIGEKGDGTQLTEIYDSTLGKFKKEYLDELLTKLSGVQNATMSTVNNMVSSASPLFGSKIVKGTTINANAGKPNDGIVLKLGGYEWMVTSLTDSGNDVVVTLMLSKVVGTGIRMSATYDQNNWITTNAPANMYASSLARQELIKSNGLFADFVGGSLTGYLVQPVDIAYQHSQDIRQVYSGVANYSLISEALDNVGVYLSGFNCYGKTGNGAGTGYSDWGTDYIWLPSYSEAVSNAAWSNNIWGLTPQQCCHDGSVYYSLFRSGMYDTSMLNVCGVDPSGSVGAWQPNLVGAPHDVGLRPAIHLNLTQAVSTAVYTAPDYNEPVETTYNAQAQTLNGLVKTTAQNPVAYSPSWYRKGIYNPYGNGNPVSGVTLKYYKGLSADGKGLKGGSSCEVSCMGLSGRGIQLRAWGRDERSGSETPERADRADRNERRERKRDL